VVRLAELLTLANPEPKFRQSEKIPLVFCGNEDARILITRTLADNFDIWIVDNVRPDTETTNTGPAKEKIHELFMENVMERAPGYAGLKKWVSADIIPTPAGVEKILRLYAENSKENILMVDMGGATTDIFSNISGDYHRTVAANIGMSYSVSNIMARAGIERIMRHLPEVFDEVEVRDYIGNKTLNPTYVPDSDEERRIEQAAAIAGLEVAWEQHREMNFKIARLGWLDKRKKIQDYNKFEDTFYATSEKYFQLSDVDVVIGAGGVLSHAETADEVFWMLTEGFKPRGITKLTLDKSFKSPHLGVLATVNPDAALELFTAECLVEIGWVVAPTGRMSADKPALEVTDGDTGKSRTMVGGDMLYLGKGGELKITLRDKVCIKGDQKEYTLKTKLPVLLDCRGRQEKTIKRAEMLDNPLSKSGIDEFSPKLGKLVSGIKASRPEIVKGDFDIERRLPYEGQIFATRRQNVKPDDVIGENRFAPPRLYILDLNRIAGYSRPLNEEEIKEGLLVAEGDNVSLGQGVFKVKPEGLGIPYRYDSPVRGRVSRIEPQGLIILREIQDYDGRPHTVNIAKQLDVKPNRIGPYMKVKEGDFVDKDRLIAQRMESGAPHLVKTPTTGTVKEIDTEKGFVTVQYDINPIPLKAFVGGEVVEVKPNHGVRIKGNGTTLYGIIGFGGEDWGRIAVLTDVRDMDSAMSGKIAVIDKAIDEEFLRKATEVKVRGIIAPSIHNADWVGYYGKEIGVALTGDEEIPFTLVLTEGFGNSPMNEVYRNYLMKVHGKHASISGRTQIRAGVSRPRIIVND
ncbi:hypothetical protein GF359_07945, partial [candidate division WOR-3 bacterium]|nr:hypothetical protein [candidate division WOR-3 bacterium]MBD3365132.1 hypothetical protein [candidate division WOR-3 bacterium]